MANVLQRVLLAMGILEAPPSQEVLAILRLVAEAGGEVWEPSVDLDVVAQAQKLGLVESTTSGTGGRHYLCLTPGGQKALAVWGPQAAST